LECREVTKSDKLPEDLERITTIPPKYFDAPDDPERHTECIMTGRAKNHLFACPPFLTEPVPKPKPSTVAMKESPTGGIGIFAGRDIQYGQLLIAERPLLITPAAHTYKIRGGDWVHDYTYEDHIKIMLFEREQLLELAFNRMDEDRKDAYMALANSHKEDGSGPLLGVQRTNGFGIDLNQLTRNDGREPEVKELFSRVAGMDLGEGHRAKLKPQEKCDMYSVIAKDASRMNHRYFVYINSCSNQSYLSNIQLLPERRV
jgi:hypothetical protein